MANQLNNRQIMPTYFIGHGSPMNAIANNPFTQALKKIADSLIFKPNAILVISAHWETDGVWVTGASDPVTIHDFYGFPDALYKIQYPSKGDPLLAKDIQALLSDNAKLDRKRGIDHGAWSILRHLYPHADIPVLQLSMDRHKSLSEHFELAQKLSPLREEGILIIGSGNIVHNLHVVKRQVNSEPYDWAVSFDEFIKTALENRELKKIINLHIHTNSPESFAVPSWEHYLPLIYVLGVSHDTDKISFPYQGFEHASISMRAVRFGE
jgi:4,5-DOPA dioxygenase extradiol